VQSSLERLARKNPNLDPQTIGGNLTLATDHTGDNSGVVAVIEAVPENLGLKQQIFSTIEDRYPTHTVLASNTSSLPIREICSVLENPGRGIGMHFFNPVPVPDLVEVVTADSTEEAALQTTLGLVRALDKTPIVVKDSPGFASPMGPLRLTDLVGLDVRLAIAEHLASELGPRFEPPAEDLGEGARVARGAASRERAIGQNIAPTTDSRGPCHLRTRGPAQPLPRARRRRTGLPGGEQTYLSSARIAVRMGRFLDDCRHRCRLR